MNIPVKKIKFIIFLVVLLFHYNQAISENIFTGCQLLDMQILA